MKGFRTLIVNAVLAVVPVAQIVAEFAGYPEVQGIVPDEYMKWYLFGTVAVNFGLRLVTTTPVGKRNV